jgi:N-dimethylarginine dimethylaminohydrolase
MDDSSDVDSVRNVLSGVEGNGRVAMNDGNGLIAALLNRTAKRRAEQLLAALEREEIGVEAEREKAEQKQSGEYRAEDWDE